MALATRNVNCTPQYLGKWHAHRAARSATPPALKPTMAAVDASSTPLSPPLPVPGTGGDDGAWTGGATGAAVGRREKGQRSQVASQRCARLQLGQNHASQDPAAALQKSALSAHAVGAGLGKRVGRSEGCGLGRRVAMIDVTDAGSTDTPGTAAATDAAKVGFAKDAARRAARSAGDDALAMRELPPSPACA